jgi:tripartite-type tricarboxylate transporter receptor subunit TctC
VPNVLVVNANVKATSLKDLIAFAQANPGKLTYASPGNGSVGHFVGETFKSSAKLDILHVPYRGAGPALNDFLAGTVDMMFDNLPTSLPQIEAGKARALAVASPERVASLPNVPTFAEAGLKDANEPAWFGVVAPANLPKDVLDRVSSAIRKIAATPEYRERLSKLGARAVDSTPGQFAAHIASEIDNNRAVAKRASIRMD